MIVFYFIYRIQKLSSVEIAMAGTGRERKCGDSENGKVVRIKTGPNDGFGQNFIYYYRTTSSI
jgi:hypothetical protein